MDLKEGLGSRSKWSGPTTYSDYTKWKLVAVLLLVPKGEETEPSVHTSTSECGESSEKFGCGVRSAWVGAGAAFNESCHIELSKDPWGVGGG